MSKEMTKKEAIDFGEMWLELQEDSKGSNTYEFFKIATQSLKQEPKTGHWIKEESIYGWDGYSYQCSECGRSIHIDVEIENLSDYPYCHCGAKMVKPQERNREE